MPVVAQATPEVQFMVVITAGVAPVGFQNRYEKLTRVDGLSRDEAEVELGLLRDFTGPLGFNAIPILEALDIPLFYLFGEDDQGGPLQANLVRINGLVANGADLEVKVYGGAGHLLPGVDIWPDIASWLESFW
jgi:pimeloyl-ACP methyl ester carboxylesterase